MKKNCKTCGSEFNEPYVNCYPCRKKRADYMRNYYNNPNGNPNRTHKYKVKKTYTKICRGCDISFTCDSHRTKYCNDKCKRDYKLKHERKRKKIFEQNLSEEERAIRREKRLKDKKDYYNRNKKLKGQKTIVCATCKTSFLSRRNKKGHGRDGKYCSRKCMPYKTITREIKEKRRKEGKHCQWCGKHICFKDADDNRLRVYNQTKFCSSKCGTASRMSNPMNRLSARFRILINRQNLLKGARKTNKSFKTLGYTKEDLCNYIESLFKDGMSWDNINDWQIDHIRPVASFNYTTTDCEDFKKCWALENLQPLWAKDNLSKGSLWKGKRWRVKT